MDAFNSFSRRAYDIDKALLPFFSNTDDFRQLLCDTGAIISGSFALQFITREVWPDIDLNLFVDVENRAWVGEWLLENGFVYRASTRQYDATSIVQAASYEEAIECPGARSIMVVDVLDTLDFVRTTEGVEKTVVLHVVRNEPIQTVLKFPFSEYFILRCRVYLTVVSQPVS